MKKLSESKISVQSSNPKYSYPIIRLPREMKNIIGKTASIYQTYHDGAPAFLIMLDKKEYPEIEDDSVESRLISIESKIDELLTSIKSNQSRKTDENKNSDGLEEIRTPDLRHVKATS